MSDNLQKKKNDKNKAQWHFKRSKSERGYELNDPDIHRRAGQLYGHSV